LKWAGPAVASRECRPALQDPKLPGLNHHAGRLASVIGDGRSATRTPSKLRMATTAAAVAAEEAELAAAADAAQTRERLGAMGRGAEAVETAGATAAAATAAAAAAAQLADVVQVQAAVEALQSSAALVAAMDGRGGGVPSAAYLAGALQEQPLPHHPHHQHHHQQQQQQQQQQQVQAMYMAALYPLYYAQQAQAMQQAQAAALRGFPSMPLVQGVMPGAFHNPNMLPNLSPMAMGPGGMGLGMGGVGLQPEPVAALAAVGLQQPYGQAGMGEGYASWYQRMLEVSRRACSAHGALWRGCRFVAALIGGGAADVCLPAPDVRCQTQTAAMAMNGAIKDAGVVSAAAAALMRSGVHPPPPQQQPMPAGPMSHSMPPPPPPPPKDRRYGTPDTAPMAIRTPHGAHEAHGSGAPGTPVLGAGGSTAFMPGSPGAGGPHVAGRMRPPPNSAHGMDAALGPHPHYPRQARDLRVGEGQRRGSGRRDSPPVFAYEPGMGVSGSAELPLSGAPGGGHGRGARSGAEPLLEELKRGGRRLELRDVAGHLAEFSLDQNGSRFIQQKLECARCAPQRRAAASGALRDGL
jgi:hypothetical protein